MSDTPVETVDVTDEDLAVLTEDAPETDALEGVDAAPEAEAADATEADAPADGDVVAEAAPEAASEPAPAPEPFTFKAFKQDYEVPGLLFDKATNSIRVEDPRGLDRLKQMLSHGREWEARGRQELVSLRKEVETLKTQPHYEVESAKTYMSEMERAMNMPREDALALFAAMYDQYPLMQAKAERAYAERLIEHQRMASAPPEPDVEVIVEQAQAGAAELVQQMLADQPWANPDVAAELTEFLQDPRTLDQYVARATRDIPDMGIRAGQYVADWDRARELADKLAKPYRTAHERTATVQQQAAQMTKTAQQNAARLAQAAPVKKAAAAPSPKPAAAAPKPSSRSELMADVWSTWKEVNRPR